MCCSGGRRGPNIVVYYTNVNYSGPTKPLMLTNTPGCGYMYAHIWPRAADISRHYLSVDGAISGH